MTGWPPDRRAWVAMVAAAVAGVALRVTYVLVAVRDRLPLIGDAETYHLLGRVLADGEGYIRPREWLLEGRRVPTAEFPPLYPTLLGLLDVVGIDSPTTQRLAGAVLGGVTVVLIGLLATAVAGRTAGIVAAWLAAVYPQLVVFDGSLLSEGLYAGLVAGTLLAVVRARATGGRAATWWWLAAGSLAGAATLTRTEAALLLPLLLVPAARLGGDGRAWAGRAGLAAAGVLALVGAWTVRNAVVVDHVQPFTNNSGSLLAGANCARVYGGPQIGLWRLDCVEDVDTAGLDETEAAARWRREGIGYALDHPRRLPAVAAVRLARTAGVWDVRSQLAFESLEARAYRWLWAGWIGWVGLAPLAVAGGVVQWRRRAELWPLVVPVALVGVLALGTYGNQRFRAMAEPSVVVLAAVAVAFLVDRMRGDQAPLPARRAAQAQDPRGSS